MSRRIVIEFLGQDKSLGRTSDTLGKKTDTLGSRLKHFGKVAAVGLAAGAVIAGRALAGMTKNAIEDDAAQRKLAIGLKNATGATRDQIAGVEDWISVQGRALGVTDDEMRPAFQRLVEATGSITEAQKQMGIAMDVSAGTGKSLKTVSEALMKANNGTTASLSKLGLKTKDANGNTLSLNDALKKMSETFGGQAAAKADTFQGKMDRLSLIFDETKETIGAKLIPVLTDLADWFLSDGLPAIEQFVGFLKSDVLPVLTDMTNWVKRNQEVLIPIAAVLGTVAAAIWLVVTATKAWRAIQLIMNAVLMANPIGLVIVAIAALAAGLVIAWKKSETFRKVVLAIASALISLGIFGVRAFRFLLTAAFNTFAGILKAASKGLGWIPGLGPKIKTAEAAFKRFGDATIAKLRGVEDRLAGVRDKINGIPSSKTFTLNMVTIRSTQNKNEAMLERAHGGPVTRGRTYLVGEEGPELFTADQSGRIIDARTTARMGGAGEGANGVVGHAVVDLRLDGRTVQRVLLKLKRTTGEGLGLA